MRAFCLGMAMASLLAGAAQAFPSATSTVKDWLGVCNNLGHCTAFGFTPEDGETYAYLRISRDAGPAATPQVMLVYDDGDTQPASQSWTLQVDGAPLPGIGALTARGGAADRGARVTLTRAQAASLIDAIRNGQHLQIASQGKPLADISLAGSAAILLWVDGDQGRAGTVTAMAGRGVGPAASVPPAAPAPVLIAAPPVRQGGLARHAPLGLTKANPDCDEPEDPKAPPDDMVARLAPGVVLWGPACDMAAYNEIYQFFLGDEHSGHMRPLSLPVPVTPDPQGGGELVNPTYDPKTQTLSAFAKGRGLGDCGSATRWVWNGKAFQLLAASVMGPCRGVALDEWPTLFVGKRR